MEPASGGHDIMGEGGCGNMKELTLEATIANIETVTNFVDEQLEELDCPMKAQMQINIAIDELFSNIARYAYVPQTGMATVRLEALTQPQAVAVTFIDSGTPYNPLEKEDPDITLSADERSIGGLGIYMGKKSMDEVTYAYENGQNVLTIRKNF